MAAFEYIESHDNIRTSATSKDSLVNQVKISASNFLSLKNSPILDEYDFEDRIGEGATAIVVKALHRLTQQTRAVKIITK